MQTLWSARTLVLLAATACADGATPPAAQPYRDLLDHYCTACHSQRAKTGGIALDSADLGRVPDSSDLWEKVIRKLRANAMPPPAMPQPKRADRDALVAWLETSIDRAAFARPNPGGTPAHRLNRTEYANAVRDLLALDWDAASLLPPDDSGFGFDNNADVLSISPMLTERYLAAARKISRAALGDPSIRPATDVFAINKYVRQDDRASEDLPFGSRGGLAVHYYFPVDAEYAVKIFLLRTYDGFVRGVAEPHTMEVRINGRRIRTFTVGGASTDIGGRPRQEVPDPEAEGQEVRFSARAGPGVIAVSFVKEAAVLEGMQRPVYAVNSYEYAGDVTILPGIGSLEVSGPYEVKNARDSPSHRRIFVCGRQDNACARTILSTIAGRAYRRPATADDLRPLKAFFEAERARAGFDAGIQAALERILVSPEFLFRIERDPSPAPHRVSGLELASRLSFFLWSSIPDDELLDAATHGRLADPHTLEDQVRRMLADPRSSRMVENFTGQWLYVRNVRLVSPDPYTFPEFDANLREAFARELELFLADQFHGNHSIFDLLTSDQTFVNERLAQHYGIPNIYGSHLRRTTLADDARRGLLGKSGILMVTSYANRTSPVLRGKWLLQNIVGAPPPPPPPNVPALSENTAGSPAHSVRERLEQHRRNPACASCHRTIDPLGFALENFDAIGAWRDTSEAGSPIDASGVLADGTKIDGPAQLRNALLAHRDDFAATVTEKLMTYALGRGVESSDRPAIRKIVREAAPGGERWSSLVMGIVTSIPFQMRMPYTKADAEKVADAQ